MANLLASLSGSANAMRAMERQLSTIQNNVSNANTPGFARVRQTVHALPFDPASGLAGGMDAGPTLSDRSDFAEQAVWQRNWLYSASDGKASALQQVEALFDIGDSGVPGAMSALFDSFSRLAVSPSDRVARQDVLDKASTLAGAVRETAAGLSSAASNVDHEISSVVDRINSLGAVIASRNSSVQADFRAGGDAGLDADTYSALEELSGLADFCVVRDPQGSLNVYLGNQAPLVLGGKTFALKANFDTPAGTVTDPNGADVSSVVQSGKLGALLDLKRNALPGYAAEFNTFAETLAGTVNAQLAAGIDAGGNAGAPLFACNPAIGAAALTVTGIAPDQIAAAKPGSPGGNRNALDLAALKGAQVLNGATLTAGYGVLAGRVGKDLASSQADRDTRQSMLTQARALRSDMSSVSLDQEASLLMQIQQQYQAAGKLIQVLDNLADTILSAVR